MMQRSIRLAAVAMAIMLALPLLAASPVAIAAQSADCTGLDAYVTTLETTGTALSESFPASSDTSLGNWTSEQFTATSDAIDTAVADLETADVPAVVEEFHTLLIQQLNVLSTMFDTMSSTGIYGALIYADQMDTIDQELKTAAEKVETACGVNLYDKLEESQAGTPPASGTPGVPSGQNERGNTPGSPGGLGTRANPIPIGQPAAIGDGWELTVLSVTPDATDLVLAENTYNDPPAADHQFFIANVRITYTGDDSDTFYGWGMSAVGQSAVAYTQFDDDCGSIPNELSSRELFTGGTIEGNLCWSIATSDADSLVLYDSDQRSGERVFLSMIPNSAGATPVSR